MLYFRTESLLLSASHVRFHIWCLTRVLVYFNAQTIDFISLKTKSMKLIFIEGHFTAQIIMFCAFNFFLFSKNRLIKVSHKFCIYFVESTDSNCLLASPKMANSTFYLHCRRVPLTLAHAWWKQIITPESHVGSSNNNSDARAPVSSFDLCLYLVSLRSHN